MYTDTISAISTALGEGGIGIVRMSGAQSLEILQNIFRNPSGKARLKYDSHRLYYGQIVDPEASEDAQGDTLDEVMAVYLAAPKTYTREPMVEINCHGGVVPLERVLNLTLRQGARLAEPGEFTLRAFINGRIDLAQAEAVVDVIRSKTGPGLEQALGQLAGNLSRRIAGVRQGLLSSLAHLEAMIDFPEDDVPPASVAPQVKTVLEELNKLLATADAGMIYRQGIRAAIVGVPNVGKSSLLNALLRADRAIVTPVAGTTRDIIEETVNIRGVPVVLVDTAGITATEDIVEALGIERSRQALSSADLLLLVLDASRYLAKGDLELVEAVKEELAKESGKKACVILNKEDIEPHLLTPGDISELLPGLPVVSISARTGEGLAELEETLARLALGGQNVATRSVMITNERHRRALERSREHLEAAIGSSEAGLPADFVSIDLRMALDALGEITGESVQDSLLREIFENFCIGK
ncbi:MAG TPA: tRNA uridine-5-carboxymethylaminomethyl(34) synthesis GTPase MnmE [Chloroflexia bacterium]|nr:tRNA uridine-5-carboxymethylaminomethyl(34) synthesis GTPase MnmE [Chloroflexia bacterium]